MSGNVFEEIKKYTEYPRFIHLHDPQTLGFLTCNLASAMISLEFQANLNLHTLGSTGAKEKTEKDSRTLSSSLAKSRNVVVNELNRK